MQQPSEFQINALVQWGKVMEAIAASKEWPGYECGISADEFNSIQQLIESHVHYNGWFSENNIRKALFAWSKQLQAVELYKWLESYSFPVNHEPRKVGIICAGNLPMVGLHDVLCVLLTGHVAYIKLSTDDNRLMPAFLQILIGFDSTFTNRIVYAEGRMNDMEAVIATGSNNTGRYFEQYFGHLPHIIRKSRTSVAILTGDETDEELHDLGNDVFDYFGLGCRSVSKLYVPDQFDIDRFFKAMFRYNDIINHNKYANNYDYNKAVWLLNNEQLLDNGFLLLKQEKSLASPTGSLYYEFYSNESALRQELAARSEEIQCVVGGNDIPFGQAQQPALWDYADGVDTIRFLLGLNG
jgi:hypothetical protein